MSQAANTPANVQSFSQNALSNDTFTVGSRTFSSRLLVGTGKYKDMAETGAAIGASEAEIVTVAIRRTNIGQNSNEPNLLDVISPDKYTILPNTAGCFDAETAIRTCQLAREQTAKMPAWLDHHNSCVYAQGDRRTRPVPSSRLWRRRSSGRTSRFLVEGHL